MVLDEPDDPLSKHKGHEVITILRYVHGAKTIKLYVQCTVMRFDHFCPTGGWKSPC